MASQSQSPPSSPRGDDTLLKRPGKRASFKNDSYANLPVLKGYLKKKSRQDKWQKRWFEVNGHYLTYYKTPDADKLLACIDLWRTGKIDMLESETNSFSIAIGDKFYVIKAETQEEAVQWIEGLKMRQTPEENSSPTAANSPETVKPITTEKVDTVAAVAKPSTPKSSPVKASKAPSPTKRAPTPTKQQQQASAEKKPPSPVKTFFSGKPPSPSKSTSSKPDDPSKMTADAKSSEASAARPASPRKGKPKKKPSAAPKATSPSQKKPVVASPRTRQEDVGCCVPCQGCYLM